MPTPKSYVTWFDEDDWISAVISFPSGSKWRVDTKIGEHEYYQPQLDVEELGVQSEARGSFICSKLSGDGPPSTFLKVRLQIPWIGTTTKKSSIRAQQATSDFPPGFHTEIEDLSVLKKANCSSTPSLLDWKEEQQTNDEWIPGGFKLCILMERLPGIDPSDGFINRTMDRPERDALRAAFKTAWIDTINCGRVHDDDALRNLLWDKQGNKCYLIDWEYCHPPGKKDIWHDRVYIFWNLARLGESERESDMDDWEL